MRWLEGYLCFKTPTKRNGYENSKTSPWSSHRIVTYTNCIFSATRRLYLYCKSFSKYNYIFFYERRNRICTKSFEPSQYPKLTLIALMMLLVVMFSSKLSFMLHRHVLYHKEHFYFFEKFVKLTVVFCSETTVVRGFTVHLFCLSLPHVVYFILWLRLRLRTSFIPCWYLNRKY